MIIGIVGKPNCGKSTTFKALTLAEVEIANYPFATIKPNVGVAYVKVDCVDKEFNTQCNPREGYCINHKRFVPVKLIDVAGLVEGAHEGKGMGNQFLEDLRQADALIHVIDISGSTNAGGEPVDQGSYNPAKDVRFLETELDMWYYNILKKGWDKFARTVHQEKMQVRKAIANQLSAFKVTEDIAQHAINAAGIKEEPPTEWTDEQLHLLATELRKATKPMIIACNKIDVPSGAENVARLENQFPDHMLVVCSAESELALKEAAKHELIDYIPGESTFSIKEGKELSNAQEKALTFIKEKILAPYGTTGVQQLIDNAVFKLLKYKAIFPGGVNKLEDREGRRLPDCFLLPGNTTALDFAFKIHTDIGNGFIKAINVKTKLPIGKDHVLENRAVVEIMSSK